MIWLIIINLNGGQPLALPMPNWATCERAREAAIIPFNADARCVSGVNL